MTKTCMNPKCGKRFTPGHYGDRQLVCTDPDCKKWYKRHYLNSRKPPRGLPREDFDSILKAFESNALFRSFMVVAAFSGLRKGEQLGLLWRDVLDNHGAVRNNVTIIRQWSDRDRGFRETKTKASGIAFLLEEAREAIKNLAEYVGTPKPDDRVWAISEASVWRRFRNAQVRLGIRNPDTGFPYRINDLRHTGAIWVYRATGDIHNAQIFLRHRNISTTQIYIQERPEDVVARLDLAMKTAPLV